ncbi:hypothetical protein [Nocardioides sp.]|uniref:hypothetical protein n=1 Tax=Nocardioides sp. TaxID=35761 RepID=UPI00262645FA|nr:hypothetical protein [Nocardioides sp.]
MITEIAVMASDDDGLAWLLAAGPAGAAATYWALYRYYRNNDKSHAFERDTLIEAQPVQGQEEKIKHISRTQDSDIDGDNSEQHRKRVERMS